MLEKIMDLQILLYSMAALGALGAIGIDVCICTGPLSVNIAKMARKNPELIVIEEPDRDSLLSHLSDYVQTGDTILVKASHFMQFEKVVAALQEM